MARVHLGHFGRCTLCVTRSQLSATEVVLACIPVHYLLVLVGLHLVCDLVADWCFTYIRIQECKGSVYAAMFVLTVL